jgi:hypothetical protein
MSRAAMLTMRAVLALLPACDCCNKAKIAHLCYALDAGLDGGVDAAPRRDAALEFACVLPRSDGGDTQQPDDADPYEPNDSFVMASAPKYKSECGPITKRAVIRDAHDVDVFRTAECVATSAPIVPVATNEIYPWAQISDGDVRVCVFPTCSDGSLHIAGCYTSGVDQPAERKNTQTQVDELTSELGFHGCCRTGKGRITAYVDCPRASAKLDTYIWIDSGSNADVHDDAYTVTWCVDYDYR